MIHRWCTEHVSPLMKNTPEMTWSLWSPTVRGWYLVCFSCAEHFSGGRNEAPRNVVNSLRPQSGDNLCRPSQLLDEDDNFHWLLPPNSWVPPHFDRERRRIDEEILRQSVRPGPGTTEKNDSELHIISSYLSADACRCSRNERCPWSRGHGGRSTLKRYIKLRERGTTCTDK